MSKYSHITALCGDVMLVQYLVQYLEPAVRTLKSSRKTFSRLVVDL